MIPTAAMRRDDVANRLRWLAAQVDIERTTMTPSGTWYRRCLMLARIAAGQMTGLYPEADIAFLHTKFRTEPQSQPPAGWLVWYDRGPTALAASDADAGHVITSAGNGLGYSNDVRRSGRVDLVRLSEPVTRWGYRRVGDTRDINGEVVVPTDTRVPPRTAPAPHLVTVRAGDSLSGLVAAHAAHGVAWADVWRDPHNTGLRTLRKRPELIRPGDHLWVP